MSDDSMPQARELYDLWDAIVDHDLGGSLAAPFDAAEVAMRRLYDKWQEAIAQLDEWKRDGITLEDARSLQQRLDAQAARIAELEAMVQSCRVTLAEGDRRFGHFAGMGLSGSDATPALLLQEAASVIVRSAQALASHPTTRPQPTTNK